jgi:hypothetical protein
MYAPRPAVRTSETAATSSQEDVRVARSAQTVQVGTGDQETRAGATSVPGLADYLTTRARVAPGSARPAVSRPDVELSAGSVTATGVAVERVAVGPHAGYVLIDRSRGIQIGDDNRQLNDFRCRIEKPHVAVDELLGNRARMRAFENLVAHPYSPIANWAFRHQMSARTSPEAPVRYVSTSGPRTTRVAARVNDQGQVVVSGSRGVQVGSGLVQRNTFSDKLVQPDLGLEPMLRAHPYLARSFALIARHPGNLAVQRFAGRIARALEHPASSPSAPSALLSMTAGMAVSFADGVQLGSRTSRTDRFHASLHHLVLTGWAQLKEVTGPGENGPAEPVAAVDSSLAQRVSNAREAHERLREAHERLAAMDDKRRLAGSGRPADAVDDISPVGKISPFGVISPF